MPDPEARKAARYYMYRKWVYEKYDILGRGNRVRIPPCVVEYIRDTFREPGCKCKCGGPLWQLYNCKRYTGHKDAPDSE